jgi:hypothetical protein
MWVWAQGVRMTGKTCNPSRSLRSIQVNRD